MFPLIFRPPLKYLNVSQHWKRIDNGRLPMIVATHQPIFLPWPGFFFKALKADAMVLLDQVQFPLGRGWMNRNRLKCGQGELWLTVPVWKTGRGKQIIRQVEICERGDWRRKHLLGLRQNYARAPYRDDYLPEIEAIYGRGQGRLAELNLELIRLLWRALGFEGRLLLQSELGVAGGGSDLLLALCRALEAKRYLALPPAAKFLDAGKFRTAGVELLFARFLPPVYPQLWGGFRYNLSTLDLVLNCGPQKALQLIARAGARD